MFTSKVKFLHLIVVDGKRGWKGTLRDWQSVEVNDQLTIETLKLKAVNDAFKRI